MRRFSKHRKVFWIVLIALLSLAVLSSAAFFVVRHYELEPVRRGEFSPELWDKYPKHRHYMVEDMEVKIDIWNLSRNEIISILGTNAASIYESGNIRYEITGVGFLFAFTGYYTIIFTEDDEKVKDIFIDYDF